MDINKREYKFNFSVLFVDNLEEEENFRKTGSVLPTDASLKYSFNFSTFVGKYVSDK